MKQKKKIRGNSKFIVLLLILLFCSITSWADGIYFYSGDFRFKIEDDGTASLMHLKPHQSSYDQYYYPEEIKIPSIVEYKGRKYPVCKINRIRASNRWASEVDNYDKIRIISIPLSVTRIGQVMNAIDSLNREKDCCSDRFCYLCYSFADLRKLEKVIGLENVEFLGDETFGGDTHFPSTGYLNLPKLKYIGSNCFAATNLREIYIPQVKHISHRAFASCPLKSIDFPELEYIGVGAFEYCEELTDVNLPKLDTLGIRAFEGCTTLQNINVTEVKIIGAQAFLNCSNLIDINLPEAKVLGDEALKGCTSLQNINCPNVKTIGNNAFIDCVKLTDVNLPKLDTLGNRAFEGCTTLQNINVTEVKIIGAQAFLNCSNLIDINLPEAKVLGDEALKGCTSLQNINCPNVKTIGNNAFVDCVKLKNVSFPKLITLGRSAFKNLKNIKTVNLPNVKTLDFQSFQNCESLTELDVPKVQRINQDAFQGCKSLERIDLPIAAFLGQGAFSSCIRLKEANIPQVTELGFGAFIDCNTLTSVDMPNIEVIGKNAFQRCKSLKAIDLHNVKSLGHRAFWECDSLQLITLTTPTPPEVDNFAFANYNATLIVPSGSEAAYRAHPIWGRFNIKNNLEKKYNLGEYRGSDAEKVRALGANSDGGEWIDVEGVTADGISQITVQFAEGVKPTDFDVKLTIDGAEASEEYTGTLSPLTEFSNGRSGFVYTAPQTFLPDCDKSSYTITAAVTYNGNDEPSALCDIEIRRPGLILIHGLGSSSDCWRTFQNRLAAIGVYDEEDMENVNYHSSALKSFDYNTHTAKVVENAINSLHMKLFRNGIISTRYDLVGHSMGGILSRLYVQEVDKSRVHRIITVNTPHFGSKLADLQKPIKNYLFIGSVIPIPGLDRISAVLYQISKKLLNSEAVRDLMPSSDAMQNLSGGASSTTGIPVHAFGSYIPNRVTKKDVEVYYDSYLFGSLRAIEVIWEEDPTWGQQMVDDVLGSDKNDQIVTIESQKGGLGNSYTTVLTDQEHAAHTKVTDWTKTYAELVKLLKAPASSDKFCLSGFKSMPSARTVNSLAASENRKEPSAGINGVDGSVKLTAEVVGDSVQWVKVHLDLSDNITRNAALTFLDDERMLVGADTTDYKFIIPEDVSGELKIYAIARTPEAKILTDSCTVEVEGVAHLSYIRFADRPEIMLMKGESMSIATESVWTDGMTRSVETDLSTDNGDIVEVLADGIYGRAAGECNLIATYGEMTDSIHVTVLDAKTAGISEPTVKSGFTIRTVDRKIEITPGQDLPDGVTMELYGVDGMLVNRKTITAPVYAGDTQYLTTPYNQRKAYILRLVCRDHTEVYKLAF